MKYAISAAAHIAWLAAVYFWSPAVLAPIAVVIMASALRGAS